MSEIIKRASLRDDYSHGIYYVTTEATAFDDGSIMLMHIEQYGNGDATSELLILHPAEVANLKKLLEEL